ncbi:MAG: DUF4350 domain-containing protein [Halobacteriota archaeon]
MRAVDLAKRLAVLVVVVVLVVAVAALASLLTPAPAPPESVSLPEYQSETLAVTAVPAEGEIQPNANTDGQSGLVVVDASHGNRIGREELAPMVDALTGLGYDVRFLETETLADGLADADAFVVVDPSAEYNPEEIETLRRFTDSGGRLLLVGEPNRFLLAPTLFGASISSEETTLTTLAAEYGMSLDTRYLYNMEPDGNAGNYKHVLAEPTSDAELGEVERVTLFTAASVQSRNGTAILQTMPNTRESDSDATGRRDVAVVDGNVMLLGDKTFLSAGRHNVADNEVFVGYLIEFLVGGERTGDVSLDSDSDETGADAGSSPPTGPATETPQPDGTETPPPNGTETPSGPETPGPPVTPDSPP